MTRADAGDGRRTPKRKRVTDAGGEGACPLWHERRGGPAGGGRTREMARRRARTSEEGEGREAPGDTGMGAADGTRAQRPTVRERRVNLLTAARRVREVGGCEENCRGHLRASSSTERHRAKRLAGGGSQAGGVHKPDIERLTQPGVGSHWQRRRAIEGR